MGEEILAAVGGGLVVPDEECPRVKRAAAPARGIGPVVELLKVLLKLKCEKHDVAQRLVATSAELERIAGEDAPEVPALHGWRRKVFGEDVLALKEGRVALAIRGRKLRLVPPGGDAEKG